jgi:anti-sigma factor RsiW
VPSDEGPGVQISFDSGEGVPITFFAVRMDDHVSSRPVSAQRDGEAVAYWRRGPYGYALAGDLAPSDLARLALDMADNPTG